MMNVNYDNLFEKVEELELSCKEELDDLQLYKENIFNSIDKRHEELHEAIDRLDFEPLEDITIHNSNNTSDEELNIMIDNISKELDELLEDL